MSEITTKPIEDASDAELKNFLIMAFGVMEEDIPADAGRAGLISALGKLGHEGDIRVMAVAAQPVLRDNPVGEIPAAVIFKVEGRDFVRVQIHTSDKPGGEEPIQLGVNGKLMFVPRGEPVEIPLEYASVLANAREWVYDEYRDGMGGLKKPREVHTYPFSYA